MQKPNRASYTFVYQLPLEIQCITFTQCFSHSGLQKSHSTFLLRNNRVFDDIAVQQTTWGQQGQKQRI